MGGKEMFQVKQDGWTDGVDKYTKTKTDRARQVWVGWFEFEFA